MRHLQSFRGYCVRFFFAIMSSCFFCSVVLALSGQPRYFRHFRLLIRQMHSSMRMKQSAAMASHTPVTPSASGWIASHTRPIRSPHIPMMLTRREKRTSPEPRLMPPAMTVKLKKISVAAAINSVLLPRAMTSGSRLNRLMMGLEKWQPARRPR